jgi:NADP-reducing hydrogenase subunit HndB
MKSLAELEQIRNRVRGAQTNVKRVVVGMATCGIAAGAKPVFDAMNDELSLRGIKNTEITIVGCIGACRLEPMVEVYDENGSRTTYVNMTAEKGRRVVAEHIVNNRVCMDLTISSGLKGQ